MSTKKENNINKEIEEMAIKMKNQESEDKDAPDIIPEEELDELCRDQVVPESDEEEHTKKVETEEDFDNWGDEEEPAPAEDISTKIYEYEVDNCLINRINTSVIPTKEENIRLAVRAKKGDEKAMEELMIRNGRLVFSVIKRYKGLSYGVQEDLLQEGLLGIRRAAMSFDETKGFSFSTYAIIWVKQMTGRYVQCNYSTIRIPVHMMEKLNKLKNLMRKYENENIEVSDKRLAKEMGMPLDKLIACKTYMQDVRSLDEEVLPQTGAADGGSVSLMNYIKSDTNVEEEAENTIARDTVLNVMKSTLTEKEFDIVSKRFGFHDGAIWTLEEIAIGYGVTRERIRQIEAKALRKMRAPQKKRMLSGFVD